MYRMVPTDGGMKSLGSTEILHYQSTTNFDARDAVLITNKTPMFYTVCYRPLLFNLLYKSIIFNRYISSRD